jgi:hypothetical protein
MQNMKNEYRGAEAIKFAVKKVKSNPDTWETEYVCEKTRDN